MSLPSFSLQSTLVLSNPCWGAQVLLLLCVLDGLGFCALVGELGEDPGYGRWDRKLVMSSSKGVRMGRC